MNVPTREDLVVALALMQHGDDFTTEDRAEVEKAVDQLFARTWLEGAYDFTNGKWGLPDKGENPYGEVED